MDEKVLLIILIIIFVIFFTLSRIAGSPIGIKLKINKLDPIITEAGIGSLLAGTFFGIVREVLLKRKPNYQFTLVIILMVFCWYILFKSLAYFSNQESSNVLASEDTDNADDVKIKDLKELSGNVASTPKLSPMYSVFVSTIILFLVIILIVSFYVQKNDGNDRHLVSFIILITCMVVLSGFFTIITGKMLDVEMKIKILAYTVAYAFVFGILAPIFVFKSFSFSNLIISTLIVFVWLTLTYSFSNFLTPVTPYINRY